MTIRIASHSCRLLFLLLVCCLVFSGCSKKKVYYPQTSLTEISAVQYKIHHNLALDNTNIRNVLKEYYSRWKGVPYRHGGMSHRGIDCSAFTYLVYKDLFTIELPRTVSEQAGQGKKISRNQLQPGDLVFFKTGMFQRHVGIYIDDLSFMHVSTIKGVMISRLDNTYWRKKYWKSMRLL